MRTSAPFVAAALAALLSAGLAPGRAAAQAWTGVGVPVCTADGKQNNVQAVSDGGNGAYIGWTDQRAGTSSGDLYLQRLGPDGAPAAGWPVNGRVVCAATGAQLLYSMAPDGSGGVYLAWEDYRSGVFSDVYGHHILADGSLAAGWPADGLPIAAFMEEQRDPELVPDGSGGVFCVWADARTYSFSQRDVYAQHLLYGGTPAAGWAANGMPVTSAHSYDYGPALAPDGSGGLYVTWTRDLSAQDIGAQHLGANGAPYPTWPDTGIVLCGAASDQSRSGLVSAPGGTAIAVWKDPRNYSTQNTETGFYGVRFGPDTTIVSGWPRQGKKLYATLNGVAAPFVASDGAGALFLGWGELVASTDEDMFVMHVDTLGIPVVSIPAPDGALSICPETSYQNPVAFVPDGEGGLYVGYDDYRDAGPSLTNPDPYVQHVTAGATIGLNWPATGVALTRETTPEAGTIPVAVPGGVIGVYARGSGAAADLYASLVTSLGTVPALVSLASSEATPERVRIEWAVSGGAAEQWRIERRDEVEAAWREVARAYADGTGRVAYEDTDVAPGARYGYRLASAAGGAALGETWIAVPLASPAFALHGVSPNPAADGARVRFALPGPGPATLALLDAQGRTVAAWSVAKRGGEQELALSGLGSVAPGVYWLRLRQGAFEASSRVALLR
jgi:hypothetical protein